MNGRVEYASADRRGTGAARSLAAWLGVDEERAAELLADGDAPAELRSKALESLTMQQKLRYMERRYAPRRVR